MEEKEDEAIEAQKEKAKEQIDMCTPSLVDTPPNLSRDSDIDQGTDV